ncbi:TPA: hypothetical protein I8Y21_006171 [Klebsiella oxytoca]|uniref:Uncharacterized protein n=1 Tax=Klebsiella oxytoca TaxID=571 RepID=A0AAN5LE50_KLEOX|nr:hypothetical protein [Klebsiella oxytoca]
MSGKTPVRRNHHARWTLNEIEFVEKHYGKLPAKDIAASLGRGISAVRTMALKLGVGRQGAEPWTARETEIVKAFYSRGAGIAKVRALLPHRDKESIRKQAARAGVTDVREWSPDALRFLTAHYGRMPAKEIAVALNKSVSAVRNRANVLRLGKKRADEWTREEEAVLLTHYDESRNLEAIHTLLPHRTLHAISAQATKMGLRRAQAWHPDEIRILQQFYPVLGRKVVAMLPGRTVNSVHRQAEKQGLRRYAKKGA